MVVAPADTRPPQAMRRHTACRQARAELLYQICCAESGEGKRGLRIQDAWSD